MYFLVQSCTGIFKIYTVSPLNINLHCISSNCVVVVYVYICVFGIVITTNRMLKHFVQLGILQSLVVPIQCAKHIQVVSTVLHSKGLQRHHIPIHNWTWLFYYSIDIETSNWQLAFKTLYTVSLKPLCIWCYPQFDVAIYKV